MKEEIQDLTIDVGCGREAVFSVCDDHFVTVKFRDNVKGIAPMNISNTPYLLVQALYEFKKMNKNFKPTCLIYQGRDFAIYYFERIL